MKLLSALLVLFILSSCQTKNDPFDDIPVIDTHIHLYDTSRPAGVPWPPESNKALFRPFMPEHYNPIAKSNGVKATVLVEASNLFSDNKWILDLTEKEKSFYSAFVSYLPVGSPDFADKLKELSKSDRFVGIRIRTPHGYPFFTNEFWRDLKTLEESGKTLGVLMKGLSLAQIGEIAKRNPKLKIAINHLAGMDIRKGISGEWQQQVTAIAKYPNVYCKVSVGFHKPKESMAKNLAMYKPCLDILLENFGEDRLIYGSNWPVTVLWGEYSGFKEIIVEYCRLHGLSFAEKILYRNAQKFYGRSLIKED